MPHRDDWTLPGAHLVAPGVHRVPLPLPDDGLRAVNIYLIDQGDRLCAVDGGLALAASRDLLVTALRGLGRELSDIEDFLVTHVHRDHYTQAVALRGETGARVWLGVGERASLELCRDRPDDVRRQHVVGLLALGADQLAADVERLNTDRPSDPALWEEPDHWLDSRTIELSGGRSLEAVSTPGHTAGHLVFHDVQAGLLFAGDHVLSTITPSVGFEAVRVQNPLGDFLRSLAVVRARPDAVLLPAHGPVMLSAHARIDQLLDHHGHRLDEIESCAAGAGLTAYEAAQAIRWTRHGYAFAELDTFNAMLAVFEAAVHLDLLVAQSRLRREGQRYS